MRYILTLSCRDRAGIVAAVASFLSEHQGFIIESAQFGDPTTATFFMRTLFSAEASAPGLDDYRKLFKPIASAMRMEWQLTDADYRPRMLIMVSKPRHCLNALLNSYAMETLPVIVPAVVSNHPDLEEMCSWYSIPFHLMPVAPETRDEQDDALLELIAALDIDFLVLARYMQILSPRLTEALKGRVINIHHSFLPSFKGAKPYHQAYDRGVKLIGATAHYVTEQLDEGAIIEQEVARVDHTATPEQLVTIGHDIESRVLLSAVRYHAERRVFLNGSKTVIFR